MSVRGPASPVAAGAAHSGSMNTLESSGQRDLGLAVVSATKAAVAAVSRQLSGVHVQRYAAILALLQPVVSFFWFVCTRQPYQANVAIVAVVAVAAMHGTGYWWPWAV